MKGGISDQGGEFTMMSFKEDVALGGHVTVLQWCPVSEVPLEAGRGRGLATLSDNDHFLLQRD